MIKDSSYNRWSTKIFDQSFFLVFAIQIAPQRGSDTAFETFKQRLYIRRYLFYKNKLGRQNDDPKRSRHFSKFHKILYRGGLFQIRSDLEFTENNCERYIFILLL